MNGLRQLRGIIASLDETLVRALCQRARFKHNPALYHAPPLELDAMRCASLFSASPDVAARVDILKPLYLQQIIPQLTQPGSDSDCRQAIACDDNCLNALAQRFNLALHVAALKREEIPEALQEPLRQRDAARLEQAITNQAVEAEVLQRILKLSATDCAAAALPTRIAAIYEQWIIPISRKIQIHHLLAGQ